MKRTFFIFCLSISCTWVAACPDDIRTISLSIFTEVDHCPDFNTLIIPIKRIQNLIVIEARMDTTVGNFILDTGSPSLVLNKTYFRDGWEIDDKATANATGAPEPLMRTDVDRLAIKELYFENLQATLSDLGHIENSRGIKILGLLGVNLFTSFEMVIDLNKEVMYLHRLDSEGKVPEAERVIFSTPILKVPFLLTNNIITLDVLIGGKKMAFCLDTGAETNALSNLIPARVWQTFHVTKRLLLLGTSGTQIEALLGTVDEIAVGTKKFKNMHAVITRLDNLGEAYGRSIDGILGNNFLVKGIISINFVKKELCMFPFDLSKP